MYEEHPRSGRTKIAYHNIDFLDDEFPRIGEIKKDPKLYELQLDLQLSLGAGKDVNSC